MGSVVLSIDAELAWGFHDQASQPRDRIEASREGWLTLLELLDDYSVPATWAVVGHLFLSTCDGVHADHPAPIGWFEHERAPRGTPPELRYGQDLVATIRNAAVPHDIGSHSFSHVDLADPTTTRGLARAEVAASLELAHRVGVELSSFVFPGNHVGHRDVLAAYGLRCYRGGNPDEPDPGLLWPARTLASATLGGPPPLVRPTVDEYGLVDVPASLYLFSFEGLSRTVVEPLVGDPIVRLARRGIDEAVESEGVFHMWLHPNNLIRDRDVDRMRSILSYVDRKQRETSLTVETMRDVADRVLTEETDREPELVS